MTAALMTQRGEALLRSNETPWEKYPRPQMRRDSYVNLNGEWDFAAQAELPAAFSQKIRVPFPPESRLSGIEQHFPEGTGLFYRRFFTLPEGFRKARVLLHIGAADQICEVYVNQIPIGFHEGGYESFSLDITAALKDGENELLIRCTDDLTDRSFPYGKQTVKRGGMWYTPVSGIWQTVWLESVPKNYIEKLNIEIRGSSAVITAQPPMEGRVTVPGVGVFPLGTAIAPEDPRFWSPEDPYLYAFTVEAGEDRVESYFALRTLEIKAVDGFPRLCLNGKPCFFHGLLDQGYWPEGLLTPPAPESFADDILAMKRLGFNMLRKHIKVEPEEFYYQCDKLGMVVFQDMVNNGGYSFLRDTALPTVGLQKLPDKWLHRNKTARQRFLSAMEATVRQLRNHPCVCCWTIFNEGWGQFDSDRVYERLRKLDDTRFIDTTSGWFRRKKTDVDSRHVYFKPVKLKAAEKPLVLSEFGGYSFKPEGHVFNTEKTYGYGKFTEIEEFRRALAALYREQILPAKKAGLCAAVYTQVSDVEDETNGLLSYDRKVCKADPAEMTAISRELKD